MLGYSPENVHLIGHSLGAHAAAEAGRRLGGHAGRITGARRAAPTGFGRLRGGTVGDGGGQMGGRGRGGAVGAEWARRERGARGSPGRAPWQAQREQAVGAAPARLRRSLSMILLGNT